MVESSPSQNLTNHPSAPVPKLRSSCDNCGDAKVKCNRQRPQCARCASLGIACIYSVSRQAGKTPRKRLPTNPEQPSASKRRRHRTPQHNRPPPPPLQQQQPPLEQPPNIPSPSPGHLQLLDTIFPLQDFPLFPFSLSPFDPQHTPTPESTPERESEKHSCPRSSYEIFRDLICPDPTLHAPESNAVTVTARFDQVLAFNKCAVAKMMELLKCACAKSGHRAMVHASIVSRVLIWYQQAVGWGGTHESIRGRGGDGGQNEEEGREGLVKVTGFAVESVPVSVGSFGVEDASVWESVRNQVVLSELKKTEELIGLFMETEEEGGGGLYRVLGMWLMGEYKRTVEVLRERAAGL